MRVPLEPWEEFMRVELDAEISRVNRMKDKIMKLNKAECFVLAKHFELHPEDYDDFPGAWLRGGKEELAFEIANKMVEEDKDF